MSRTIAWVLRALCLPALLLLVACGTRPPAPAWQMNAQGALARYQDAYLSGAQRAAEAEFVRAREALAATGQPTLVARAELTRCALRVASLDFEPCVGFEPLRADAAAPEQAYADYLQGMALEGQRIALLPPQHRQVAAGAQDLKGIEDPLGRLIAAGVLLRRGQASPQVLAIASDTASAQGWRRPLLAWLGAQERLAEQAGDTAQVERLHRRMVLLTSGSAK